MKRNAIIAIFALTASLALGAQDFKAMLKAIDEMGNYGSKDYSATYSIVTSKPGENPSSSEIQIFRRDDRDQIVILINKPDKQKGQGYLKIDDNVYFYDPDSGNFSHSTMKENLQNSEAKNSDFKRYTFAEDYDIVSTASAKIGSYEAWVLDLKAKNNEVSYQRVRISVRKDRPIPLKEEDFSVSDRLMRTVYYGVHIPGSDAPNYIDVAGKRIPATIKMVDELNKGEQSVLTISNVTVDKLPDSTFTKAFLLRAR